MGANAGVLRDPARHEQLLSLLRAAPRVLINDIASAMSISRSCARNLVELLKHEGKAGMEIDITMRCGPRSGAPLVAWLVTPATRRLSKRIKPRPIGFTKRASGAYVYPYAPTGTPAHQAGRIQLMAVQGRAL